MAAKAVVVFDPNNQPLSNVEVTIKSGNGDYTFPLTNSDGYALADIGLSSESGYVKVVANGFKSYLQLINLDNNNQTIRVGNPQVQPNDIVLPPLSFSKPSRDSIINVKANLCNLRDADDIPIFEPFISSLIVNGNKSKYNDWLIRAKQSGATHFHAFISGAYPEDLGWTNLYPIPSIDLMNRLSDFNIVLNTIKSYGLIPIIKLAFDGQVYDPFGQTYGWLYGIQNLQRIADSLHENISDCLWSTGFDGCFPNWNPIQIIQMLSLMRSLLGDNCQIDTEFGGPGSVGYCHLGNGADDWTKDKLGMLDHFSIEVMTYPPNEEGVNETATRLLGPACKIGPTIPYYLEGLEKKIAIDFYETCAYQAIRKQIIPSDAVTVANFGKSYGFTCFGNGLPNS